MSLGSHKRLLTPNLAFPPRLVQSGDYPGIQIADVLASACRRALQDQADVTAKRWLQSLMPCISSECVLHNSAHIDLDTSEAVLNAVILLELLDRSLRGEDILDGMGDYIRAAQLKIQEEKGPFSGI